jgi:hypothetical protein
MSADVIKLPFAVTRRAHSRKARRSKNGTPAAMQSAPADAAVLRIVPTTPVVPAIDGRKLRDSPLRGKVALVSLGATVVGQMRTAELKGRPRACHRHRPGKSDGCTGPRASGHDPLGI